MAKRKTTAGRGKKQCPECKEYVASATRTCDCGHAFQAKAGAKSAPSSDIVAAVVAAQDLIKKCGGAREAISLLKSLSKTPF